MKQLLLCFVLLGLRQLPEKTHVHLQLRTKQAKQLRSFFENGERAVTLPTAALPPPFKAFGRSTCANQIRSAATTFPAGPLGPFQLCQTSQLSPVIECRRDCSGLEPSRCNWDVEILFDLKYDVDHSATVFVC